MIMEFIFYLFLFLVFYCYLGYPLCLIVFGFLLKKKPRKAEVTPFLSLLIPVYNEEKIIQRKIENALSLDYPKDKLEIVIASESQDKTNEIAEKYKQEGIKVFSFPERKGKQNTIYRVLPFCQGEIIVLTDANGMFERNALRRIVRGFADQRVGCVSGRLQYQNPKKAPVGEGEGVYWKYEVFLKNLESKTGFLLGANGSIYAIRKSLYQPISPFRSDDFDLPIRVALQGYWALLENEAVSEEEVYSEAASDFKRKTVIVGWHIKGAFILLKESLKKAKFLLAFELVSHKILRWLIGFFLVFIFLSNIFLLAKPFYLFLFLGQIIFYSLAFLGYLQDREGKKLNKLVNLAYYFCLVNIAAMIGVIKGIFGKQTPTWEKVR